MGELFEEQVPDSHNHHKYYNADSDDRHAADFRGFFCHVNTSLVDSTTIGNRLIITINTLCLSLILFFRRSEYFFCSVDIIEKTLTLPGALPPLLGHPPFR